MAIAMSFGSSAPLTGNSQLPCSSFLPMQTGWLAVPYSSSRTCTSISERFSSTTMMRSSPSANSVSSRARDRPRAGDLEDAQAEIVALHLVDAELVERLAHVEIALADGDDADLRIAPARGDDAVELVGAHEGEHRVALVVVQPRFHAEDRSTRRMLSPPGGIAKSVGDDDLDAIERAVDHARSIPPSRACI